MDHMTSSPEFCDLVLRWLRDNGHPNAASVQSVIASGSDWYGSTDDGFHPEFSVDIRWTDGSGKGRYEDVNGELLASLWMWVVTQGGY